MTGSWWHRPLPITPLVLRQRDLAALERHVLRASDPHSATYQQWLTLSAVQELVSPSAADKKLVWSWLHNAASSLDHHEQDDPQCNRGSACSTETPRYVDHGDVLSVETTVRVASSLFRCAYYEFRAVETTPTTTQNNKTTTTIVRTPGPYELPHLVEFVVGISGFPRVSSLLHRTARYTRTEIAAEQKTHPPHRRRRDDDNQVIVPQTIANLYNIRPQQASSALNTSQGVLEFVMQSFSPLEVTRFGEMTHVHSRPPQPRHIIGPNRAWSPEPQGALDTEMLTTTNIEADNWFWLESGGGWLYQFVSHAARTLELPMVLSISYGWYELGTC